MGDPKKHRKTFSTPKKAWEKERIDEEKELIREYHFKNKQEIWKLNSKLRNFARQAKKLIASTTEQSEKEEIQLLTKLKKLGLLPESGDLDDVLGISTKNIIERRLQSIAFKNGLARTMKQARQFIVHGHILVDGKKVTSPNYLVPKDKEGRVEFYQGSALIDPMHPERKQEEKLPKKPVKEEKKVPKKNKAEEKKVAPKKVEKKEVKKAE
ncbi:MAG: 30S ribosomal protein S4 [Candidatus Woesearchaeota archaeon]